MSEQLLTRDVNKLDLLRILEREFNVTARGLIPLQHVEGDGNKMTVTWLGVRLVYEEPVAHDFGALVGRSYRTESAAEEGQVDEVDEESGS